MQPDFYVFLAGKYTFLPSDTEKLSAYFYGVCTLEISSRESTFCVPTFFVFFGGKNGVRIWTAYFSHFAHGFQTFRKAIAFERVERTRTSGARRAE